MTTRLPWNFEPCENEGERDDKGTLYPHAVRGRREEGRMVTGYGHTAPAADTDARRAAQQFDAHEVLGERGEVIHTVCAGTPTTITWNAPVMTTEDARRFYDAVKDLDLLTRYGGLS